MGSIASVSQSQLARRRRLLRKERRRKISRAVWQLVGASCLAGGLVWAASLPAWRISSSDRIEISGNQFLSESAIRLMLPLSYPQSLLRLNPEAIEQNLESMAPIAGATVSRKLFPPGLKIEVTERHPVAIAQRISSGISSDIGSDAPRTRGPTIANSPAIGFLDARGVWMPEEHYTSLDKTLELPTLKVIGNPSQYRPYWPELYQTISRSPVRVYEIDWRDPTNLILKTELGIVHLGAYTSRFAEQVRVLDRMRQLPKYFNPTQIAYIDLKNPDSPTLQMTEVGD